MQIKNLHVEIDDKEILDVSVNAGEVHAITGPNGVGKATLGYVLGGLPKYDTTAELVG